MDIQKKITAIFGEDKMMHFLAGGWLACLGSTWLYALLIGLTIGLFKEIVDKYIRKSTFDFWDWVATFAGSVVTASYLITKQLFIY